jgi:hypothetical protein
MPLRPRVSCYLLWQQHTVFHDVSRKTLDITGRKENCLESVTTTKTFESFFVAAQSK